ncbi:glycoside hydrolase family protein, partial [Burkholderia gladioli]
EPALLHDFLSPLEAILSSFNWSENHRAGQSTLLRMLNASARPAAADQFLVWNRAGGVVSDGLKRRRAAERDLFLTGEWS